MKRRHAVVLAVLAGTLGWIGCDRAAPTEPDRALAQMPPEKVMEPAPLQLAGYWKGTITFHPFQGNLVGLECSGAFPISAALGQEGAILTGQCQTGCAGMLEIHGRISGGGISGSLDTENGGTLGRIYGTVSASSIAFQTKVLVDESDDGSPNRGGGHSVVSSDVELFRQDSMARNVSLAAGGDRSTRTLPPRR